MATLPITLNLKPKIILKPTSALPTASSPSPSPSPSIESANASIEDMYKQMEHTQHVLEKPGVYLASIEPEEREMWIMNTATARMEKRKIVMIPALIKLYEEGIVNMRDHYVRMRCIIEDQQKIIAGQKAPDPEIDVNRKYHPVKSMNVTIDPLNNLFVMRNDGDGIDVVWHKDANKYVPQMIFGQLLTGRNFNNNKKRIVGGQNGYGAKIINLFSSEFILETVDAFRSLKYVQRFANNMSVIDAPVITPYKGAPYTQITFVLDVKRFGLNNLTETDTVQLMQKRVYDLSGCTPKDVSVYYNGNKVSIPSFERYVDLYIGIRGECKRVYTQINQDWEIVVCASPNGVFEQISFVNGIWTSRGGKHVEHVKTIISKRLADYAIAKEKGHEEYYSYGHS
jgi:DNA topoisomerase II